MAPRPMERGESRAGGRSEPLTVVLQWDRGQRRVPTRKAGYGVAAATAIKGTRRPQIPRHSGEGGDDFPAPIDA